MGPSHESSPWTADAASLLRPLRPRLLRFDLVPEARLDLGDDPGSLVRRAFGAALRTVACPRPGECGERCVGDPSCLYSLAFETPAAAVGRGHTGFSHWPHPMVLRVESARLRVLERGFRFMVETILLGPVRDATSTVVEAMVEAGRRGLGRARAPFVMAQASVVDEEGKEVPVYVRGETLRVEHLGELPPIPPPPPGTARGVEVVFLTPTRLQVDGGLVTRLPFPALARAILRRYVSLAEAYGGGRPPWSLHAIAEDAEEIGSLRSDLRFVDSWRWSSRQRCRLPEGGLVGRVEYRGPIRRFAGLLQAGEFLHVGKGTLLGHGRYRIRFW